MAQVVVVAAVERGRVLAVVMAETPVCLGKAQTALVAIKVAARHVMAILVVQVVVVEPALLFLLAKA
jgi:hypothetical protein